MMKKIHIAAILCTLFFIAATAGCSTKNPNGATTTQVAANISNAITCWSPSGEKLAYTQWDGKQYNSSIVSLEFKE